MGALRVVLLAEGSGDLGDNQLRSPADVIVPEHWGPAHALLARAIAQERKLPIDAIQFQEPLRTRGRVARGSDLKHARTLRQLLNYLPAQRPDLLLVLVDADGVSSAEAELETAINDVPGTKVVIAAVQEFEAWLLAVHDAQLMVENLPPRAAKERLATSHGTREARRQLAEHAELDALAKACASFNKCLKKLRA